MSENDGHQVQIVSEYHCPTCAALGYLGTHIDMLEAALRKIASLDTRDDEEAVEIARAALGEL